MINVFTAKTIPYYVKCVKIPNLRWCHSPGEFDSKHKLMEVGTYYIAFKAVAWGEDVTIFMNESEMWPVILLKGDKLKGSFDLQKKCVDYKRIFEEFNSKFNPQNGSKIIY